MCNTVIRCFMALQMDKYTAIAVGSERGGTASDRHSSRQNLEPSHQGQVERLIFYRSSSPTRNQIHNSINSFNILFRMEGCGFNHCQNYAGTVRKNRGSARLGSARQEAGSAFGRAGFFLQVYSSQQREECRCGLLLTVVVPVKQVCSPVGDRCDQIMNDVCQQ